jgi:hypothetical protein
MVAPNTNITGSSNSRITTGTGGGDVAPASFEGGRELRHGNVHAPRDPCAVHHPARQDHRDGHRHAVENGLAQIATQKLRRSSRRRMRRHQRMRDGTGRRHGQPIEQQRPFAFAREVPHQRDHDDEADLEEDRQAHQKGRQHHRPGGTLIAEPGKEPVCQHPPAARVFEKPPDHRAHPDHDGDEAQRIAEPGLNGLQDFFRRHPGRQPHRHAGNQQSQECVKFDYQNQKQQQGKGSYGEQNKEIAIGGHEGPFYTPCEAGC